jgi:hypothetical protein
MQAERVQRTLLDKDDDNQSTKTNTGFVDLRTATPCLPNEDNHPHCVNFSFPCVYMEDRKEDPSVVSTLGSVYSTLFHNMHACPNDPSIYNVTSCPRRTGKKKGVHELKIARDAIQCHRKRFPEMFELNGTHIDYVLQQSGSLVTLEQLTTTDICAMQFRFGDYWFRNSSLERYSKDKRLCKELDKESNQTFQCFEHQADILLNEACPNASIPVYLATDWEEFAHYMCEHHQKSDGELDTMNYGKTTGKSNDESNLRKFISRCPSSNSLASADAGRKENDKTADNQHIHDVDLASESGQQILNRMLTDWLVLALAKTSELRKKRILRKQFLNARLDSNSPEKRFEIVSYGSTFVETADLQWKVV